MGRPPKSVSTQPQPVESGHDQSESTQPDIPEPATTTTTTDAGGRQLRIRKPQNYKEVTEIEEPTGKSTKRTRSAKAGDDSSPLGTPAKKHRKEKSNENDDSDEYHEPDGSKEPAEKTPTKASSKRDSKAKSATPKKPRATKTKKVTKTQSTETPTAEETAAKASTPIKIAVEEILIQVIKKLALDNDFSIDALYNIITRLVTSHSPWFIHLFRTEFVAWITQMLEADKDKFINYVEKVSKEEFTHVLKVIIGEDSEDYWKKLLGKNYDSKSTAFDRYLNLVLEQFINPIRDSLAVRVDLLLNLIMFKFSRMQPEESGFTTVEVVCQPSLANDPLRVSNDPTGVENYWFHLICLWRENVANEKNDYNDSIMKARTNYPRSIFITDRYWESLFSAEFPFDAASILNNTSPHQKFAIYLKFELLIIRILNRWMMDYIGVALDRAMETEVDGEKLLIEQSYSDKTPESIEQAKKKIRMYRFFENILFDLKKTHDNGVITRAGRTMYPNAEQQLSFLYLDPKSMTAPATANRTPAVNRRSIEDMFAPPVLRQPRPPAQKLPQLLWPTKCTPYTRIDLPESSRSYFVVTVPPKPVQASNKRSNKSIATASTDITDAQQESEESMDRIPWKGMRNLGNTCYLNAVMQSLSGLNSFRDYFKANDVESECAKSFGQLIVSLSTRKEPGLQESEAVVNPQDFKNIVDRLANDYFPTSTEHDAVEFLNWLLVQLDTEMNEHVERRNTYETQLRLDQTDDIDDKTIAENSETYWAQYCAANKSEIVKWITGQEVSKIKCQTCDSKLLDFLPFTYLSLPIPDAPTLQKCLTEYQKKEEISASCECGPSKEIKKDKTLLLAKLPETLVFQLKRFYVVEKQLFKIDTMVSFDET